MGYVSRLGWEDHCSVHERTVPPTGPASDAMAHLANLAQTTKLTLDNREDSVVDLSSELVEKDLQVERLSQRITTLEQQVEFRDNTIDVLENKLHNV
jgi:chromosome segregation ATPase